MKRFLILTLIMTLMLTGCASGTTTNSETPKGKYNIAYVSIAFLTYEQKEFDKRQKESNPDYTTKIESIMSKKSSTYFSSDSSSFYCLIDDWEYAKNDTIILYLTDGRIMQTSSDNVLLMYDPDLEK